MIPSKPAVPATEKLRILLVDDEWCIRELMAESLVLDGYEVETAADGLEALEKLEESAWDVVITDRAMPRMDGQVLAREIKRRWKNISIIMITGLCSAVSDETRGRLDVLLSKPFSMETLAQALMAIERTRPQLLAGQCIHS